MRALHSRLGGLKMAEVLRSIARSLFCAVIMGVVVWQVSCYTACQAEGFADLAAGVTACVSAGVVSYTLLAFAARSRELAGVMAIVRKRRA